MVNQTDINPQRQPTERSVLAVVFLGIVRLYQLGISPLLGPRCRFQPTCSSYAAEAIIRFGALKGGWLAIKRIGKCHPWGGFGYDPVPQGSSVSASECGKTDHEKET